MSLTNFRTLGRSGLVVSPIALGTMTFGPGGWNADDATSRAIFDAYRSAGGNFIDTADVYSGGGSETLVGRFIKDTGSRDEVVLATKFAFNASANPLVATHAGGGNPNAGGAGAKNIHRALDASLRRLGTDYIDLYWMHIWDGVTPVEEIVQTLGGRLCRWPGAQPHPRRPGRAMIALASGLRVYLACGVTDMRKGMTGLAMLVQQTLAEDPFGGAVFAFRGRRAGLVAAFGGGST